MPPLFAILTSPVHLEAIEVVGGFAALVLSYIAIAWFLPAAVRPGRFDPPTFLIGVAILVVVCAFLPLSADTVPVLVWLAGFAPGYLVLAWLFPVLLRPMWWLVIHTMYRFRVHGRENVPATGPALIVGNHTVYIDWMVMWVACPRPVRFVLWANYFRNPVLRFFLSWVRHRTVRVDTRTDRPHAVADALDAVAAALRAGEVVLLFPEGRLTRNGYMLPFTRGIERILKQAGGDVPVIPTATQGLWGSVFSHKGGRILRKWPENLRRSVAVQFGRPRTDLRTAPEVRAAVVEATADLAVRESDTVRFVPAWFVRSACKFRNLFRVRFVDTAGGTERTFTGGQALVGSWCLSRWLGKRLAADEPHVGVWLPTGMGSTLANLAVAFRRRTSVNLNYTAGREANLSAARQVGMRHVVTSRRFVEKMPLDLPAEVERLYLEDAIPSFPKWEKALKLLAAVLLPGWLLERLMGLHRLKPDDLLTIIFSSGSTGEPKGVMLTQRNIGANGISFIDGVGLAPDDTMLATLPFFHSFGFTVCLWAPAGLGMKVVYHPDPRAGQEVGELCRRHRCTIFLATATFLRFYLRRSGADDFKSLKYLVCGAEKLPVQLAEQFRERFGVLPLEGYGCTEVSPVVSTNLPDVEVAGVRQTANTPGTVGQPIPGVAARAFHPDTREPLPPEAEGVIGIKGPNVMLGYFRQPGKTAEAVRDGWYSTGDVGLIEPDGFIRITGRLSRFAKIAGEMVPLEKLEEHMQELLGTGERLVTVAAVPDDRRGERLVVLYLPEAGPKLDAVLAGLPKRGLPNLWVPDRRDCHPVEAFPALGSGKLDLRAVGELAKGLATR